MSRPVHNSLRSNQDTNHLQLAMTTPHMLRVLHHAKRVDSGVNEVQQRRILLKQLVVHGRSQTEQRRSVTS